MDKVWLDLTQEALDAAYDQNVYAPNRQQILDRYATNSDLTRDRLGQPERHAYGAGSTEQLDLYRSVKAGDGGPSPVSIFIHGGAWRSGSAADYGFLAETFVRAGAHLVVPDFDWVQQHNGDLLPIADQVRRSIEWVCKNASALGVDSEQIYLAGHSSGAHLAAVALTPDQPGDACLRSNSIKGVLLCSGMYELTPVSLSSRSSYVRLDKDTIERLSPLRHLKHLNASLVIAYGSLESPEFQRQSAAFGQACRDNHLDVDLIHVQDVNHFEIIETLGNPYGVLGRAALRQMSLLTYR